MRGQRRASSEDAPTTGARSETVRQSNLASILTSLHIDGPASRSELVARTGLTRSAVGGLIGELTARGLVSEARAPSAGTPGRPSPIASVRGDENIVVGIEILVDSIAIAAVGLGGSITRIERAIRPRDAAPPELLVHELASMIHPILEDLGEWRRLHAVGAAVAGIVHTSDRRVIFGPNLGWHDVPLGDLLRDALDVTVPVIIGNDGDLGALAERRRGAGRGAHDLVYVSGEVGIGGGIISEDRSINGRSGFAGEVGHMQVNPDGLRCACGSIGCWETEAGEDALLRRAGLDPADSARAVEQLVVDVELGDRTARAAFADEGRWLGIGIASLVNLFSPERVVLGGFLHRIFPHVVEPLTTVLDERALAASRAQVEVVAAELGINAPLLGAAEAAWDSVLTDPGTVHPLDV